MDGGDEVEIEHVNGGLEKVQEHVGLVLPCVNKENKNNENSVDVSQGNGVIEGSGVIEGTEASGGDGETASIAVPSDGGHAKKVGADALGHLKKCGTQKGEVDKKASAGVGRKQRHNLSQSLIFPSKGILTSGLRKSFTDARSTKVDSTSLRTNGSETTTVTNGKISSIQSKLASATRTRQLLDAKIGETPSGLSSKTPETHRNLKSSKDPAPLKTDEDARSTTSTISGTAALRKSTGSGFAFRLDERAEKRKEFFMKLEEKIHAIEAEKTNQQEKSKEDQEAEIKMLRKSLTFKATPMPSFYKEPAPPKIELKKIPTTRPISPKLGRRKASGTTPDVTLEGSDPEGGLHPSINPSIKSSIIVNASVGISAAPKNPIRKSFAKLPTQKITAPKPEAKSLDGKAKTSDPSLKTPDAEVDAAEILNNLSGDHSVHLIAVTVADQEYAENAHADFKTTTDSPDLVIACQGVH